MSEVWFDVFQAAALWIGAGCSVMCAAGLRFWVTVTLRFYVARHGRLPSRWFVGLCFAWAVMTWPKTFWALARVR
jgi:hypothetical protein